jgi:hypothetical protein
MKTNWRQGIIRALLSLFVLSVFLFLILQPTVSLDPLTTLAVIITVEVAAYAFVWWLGGGKSGTLLRLILISAVLAGFYVYVLKPSGAVFPDSFDAAFLAIWIIEASAFTVAYFWARKEVKR